MSFFKKMFGAASEAIATISGEAAAAVSQLQRQDDVEAMLAIVALVAGADGEVEQQEREMAVDFVRQGDVFKNFDRTRLASTLEENFRKCANAIMRDDLFDKLRGIADEPDTAKKVLNAGIAIAGSDGDFEAEEKEVLIEAAQALGLNPQDFRKLRS